MGLRSIIAAKKPLIRDYNRIKRLAWCKKIQNWSIEDWKRVLFTDETKKELFGYYGKSFVRRPKGQKYNPKYMKFTVKHGGSIML